VGNPEIRKRRIAKCIEQNIARFQVTVDDPLAMNRIQGGGKQGQ
jgi:hypothetical protein